MSKYDVVTTVYNDEDKVIELLEEVEAQTLLPSKVYITDGGSKDNTVAVIKEFAKRTKLSIVIYEGERLNIAQGFNKGIMKSNNIYIGIVACGNHYPPNYFECLVKTLDVDGRRQIAFASVHVDVKNDFSKAYEAAFMEFYENFPSNHGNLIRTDLFGKYGYFCEEFSYAGEDTEYFGRIKNKKELVSINLDTYCIWEEPNNFKDYIKQTKNYIIGNMELFDNRALLFFYKKKILYCFLYLVSILMLLIPLWAIKLTGCTLILMLILFNIRLYLKNGKDYFLIRQIDYTYWFLIFLTNKKLFFKSNKISHPLNICAAKDIIKG